MTLPRLAGAGVLVSALFFALACGQGSPMPMKSPNPEGTLTPRVAFVTVVGAPAGGTARTTISTTPRAHCTIEYLTPTGAASSAEGLTAKTADEQGSVSWSWQIEADTPRGVGIVTVRCDGAGRSVPIGIGEDLNVTPRH
jgi:hypothetical protein